MAKKGTSSKRKKSSKQSFWQILSKKIHQIFFILAIVIAIPVTAYLANLHTNSQNTPAHAAGAPMPVGFSPGYNFEKSFGQMTSTQQQAVISQMKSNGVTWLRLDYWTGDTFDYAFMQQAEAAGIQVDALLENFTTAPADWGNVATQTVNTLKPLGVHTYEILNEVNSYSDPTVGTINATKYESILQAAYPAIKAADPTATVLFSGLDMSKDPNGYLQGVYTAGGKNYFDAVNVHPYAFYPSMPVESPCPTTNAFCSGVPALYSVMQQNNDSSKKIWITEFGCPTGTDGGYPAACTDSELAQQLTQAYNQAKSWSYIGSFFMYNYKDDAVGNDGDFGVYDANGQAKPNALAAFQQIAADASGLVTTTPTSTSPASISVSSLTATGATAGQPTTFNYTLNTTGSITVENLIVAIRDASNTGHDTPVLTNIALSGNQSFTQSQTLSAGTYTYWVAYETNGQWHDLDPKQTLVIGGPSVTVSSLMATGTKAGSPTTFTYTLNTTGSMTVDNLIVAIRDASGNGYDTPVLTNVALSGTQNFTQSQTLAAGTYTYWVAYEQNGNWNDLSPKQNLTITNSLALSNLSIKDISHASSWSIQSNIQTGNTFYGDRSYTISTLPSSLAGAAWVRTANASKTYSKNPLVTFSINTQATIYVGFDNRTKKPSWLNSSWTNTGLQMKDSEPITFTFYKKVFPAGTVSLGQNSSNNASGVDMYTVIVGQ